ncbi:hypothetical protein [Flavihumibacter sp. UBA7668]|uniref:hypothetical protein n=1 Tax=Flavihumibacter sp. UBA7668 TaxID=1946542 RepID=UPI0025C391B5|nr:hypothetical protein [Flavihumibacter sp. UBA7668]
MIKYLTKILPIFLGTTISLFGLLKFTDPFKTWYSIQIETSGLGKYAYWMGIIGELSAGILFLFIAKNRNIYSSGMISRLNSIGSILIISMMVTGMYVHLHPEVPATVLPLKIKPPYIPGFFLLLAVFNLILNNLICRNGRMLLLQKNSE